MRALLSLGSNIGDRGLNLRKAVEGLRAILTDLKVSPVYGTSPVEFLSQGDFFNLAASGDALVEPGALLAGFLEIERALGRERLIPKGPRVIDIDLIYFGRTVLEAPALTLPHPARLERRFVLEPLCAIEPDFVDPVLGRTIRELASAFRDPSQRARALGPLESA